MSTPPAAAVEVDTALGVKTHSAKNSSMGSKFRELTNNGQLQLASKINADIAVNVKQASVSTNSHQTATVKNSTVKTL